MKKGILILPWSILAGLLSTTPGMAQQSVQEPRKAQAKQEAASKAQSIARDAAAAKAASAPAVGGEPASGKQAQGVENNGVRGNGVQTGNIKAEPAGAKAGNDDASADNGAAANHDSPGPNTPGPNTPVPNTAGPNAPPHQGQQRGKGAAPNDEDLRKQSQNPVANLISFPLQNNTNMGIEPADRNQNVLNIQPVIPVSLNENWQMIIRWIIPIIWQPIPDVKELGFFGLGDMVPTFFFSPKKPAFGKLIWGVGPALQIPTATNAFLGQGKFCLGPSVVALAQPGPWTIGALVNNVWSVAPDNERPKVNQMLLQYFINYNMRKGWYLTSSPILTADWEASEGKRWVVPFGGGVGRVMRLGFQPVNISAQAFGNAKHPDGGATWQLRFQFVLLFPTGKH